jgi:uncharacterized protein YdcH (DUF465 family)
MQETHNSQIQQLVQTQQAQDTEIKSLKIVQRDLKDDIDRILNDKLAAEDL